MRSGFVLITLSLAALLAVLDGTVVAVALDSLTTSLRAPVSTVVWVTIGYLLAAATALPLTGWASARFGQRSVFLAGLAVFVLGSALCAAAWSAPTLVAARVVQGFGGGLMEPMALTLAATLAPKDKVGRVLGTLSMVINVAPVLGPIVGGLLLATGHWQWLFLVNLPFGIVVIAAVLVFVPADQRLSVSDRPRIDAVGLVLLTSGFVAVLFALNRSGRSSSVWSVAVIAGAGVLMLAAYGRRARRSTIPPVLDLRLLRRPGFGSSMLVLMLVGFTVYSQLTSLPLFGTQRHGLAGLDRGLIVTALGLGMIVSMTAGGRISDRSGPRPLVRFGSLAVATGFLVFALLHDTLPLPAVLVLFLGIGLVFGFCAAPTFAGVYRILDPSEAAQGTTALFISVQFGASLGVTVLGVLQDWSPGAWIGYLFGLLTAGALVMTVLAQALPGRPAGDRPEQPAR